MAEAVLYATRKPGCHLSALVAGCLALSGCAYSYVDDHGDRHVMGLVNLKIASATADETFAGPVVDLTTFGIAASSNAAGRSFTIGYSREVTGYLRNNVLVVGAPLAIRTAGQLNETKP